MQNIVIDKKDDIVMKLLHYFVTEYNYKPVVVNGLKNEVWLENMDNDIKLIRLNINYIHNNEQLKLDTRKANIIRESVKKKTYSFKMHLLNILIDLGDAVVINDDSKEIINVKGNKLSDIKKNKKINEYFPDLKDKVVNKKSNFIDMYYMTEALNKKTRKEEKRLSKLFKTEVPYCTYFLIGINILLFLVMLNARIYNLYLMKYSTNYELIQQGEIYRLFTSMFLHANFVHLFFNMYALYIIGPEIEKYYGKLKFLIIYLVSGIFGSIFSALFNNGFSIGASGAIFGLFGALTYFGYNYRATLDGFLKSQIIPLLVVNLAVGLIFENIDLAAHIGGLLSGIFISVAVGLKEQKKPGRQINALIMLCILLISFIFMLFSK